MKSYTRVALVAMVLSLGAATTASAQTSTGGVTAASTTTTSTAPAPATTTPAAPAAPGTVAIPAGMRTTNGTKAKRYRGKTESGRRAYFARVPLKAPAQVQNAVIAANKIVGLPYKYGGGHAETDDTGYDCSGTISYALRGAGLLKTPMDSSGFMSFGEQGAGQWFTIYANEGHAFMLVAGLRLDTSAASDKSGLKGPQWRPAKRTKRGFDVVHPDGL